jgi:glycerol kinase
MQFQADILGVPVFRPQVAETTALGAAYLAGLAVGYWQDLDELTRNWAMQCEYLPQMARADRDTKYDRWLKAVERSLGWAERVE